MAQKDLGEMMRQQQIHKANVHKNISDLVSQSQDASSSFNIGLTALRNGRPEAALKKFAQTLEIDSSEDMQRQIYPNMGQAYLQLGEFDRAIAEFRRSLRLNPPPEVKAFIYANLGYIYTQRNFYGFAIQEYRQAIKEYPKDSTSHLTLGMLYENKFRYQEAREAFEILRKQDPGNAYAQESLERLDTYTPVQPREDIVRLVKLLPTLGAIMVMSYDATYDGYFPMIIYLYPDSPLQDKAQPGDKILNVYKSGEMLAQDDARELWELLEAPPNTAMGVYIGENEVEFRSVAATPRQMEQSERLQVYRQWLKTFDSRLAWLWSSAPEIREHIGPLWGQELESLVRELYPLKHTQVYDFAYGLMIEHMQVFSITETDPESGEQKEIRMEYQIHLGRFPFGQAFPDLIQQFHALQFTYVANLLAART